MSENLKKIIVLFFVLFIAIGIPAFFIFRKKKVKVEEPKQTEVLEKKEEPKSEMENLIDSSRLIGGLPTSEEKIGVNFNGSDGNSLIEYVSFLDFYEKIKDDFKYNISDYDLPINVKTEVSNYYDISRKINLDKNLDSLNNNGFAIVDNPLNATNFYDIYDELYKNKIPALISSDFLIYYYQYTFKKTFKDIEENIFYTNLWEINRILYENARIRYEDSLSKRGLVNDRILEAQRLAAAYFATSLELLKPTESQINKSADISNPELFSVFEINNYNFSLPDYLKVDVEKEVKLIRDFRVKEKSPVLLYERDYKEFLIPNEYKAHAKLNNFYLTTKWLSSNFPLYHKSEECSLCSLDFDDWRINIISSSFIAKDIFDSHELKNKWARIYKTLAFFKGLRGDLTYVHYRDALISVFGNDYKIEEVFADNNPESINNLYKFRNKVLEYNFFDIEGALNKNLEENKPNLGVKMLTGFYWPNDYIMNKLSYPNVSNYQGSVLAKNNITSCDVGKDQRNSRCNGFSLDIIALINEKSLSGNSYYFENSNYKNYSEELSSLKSQLEKFPNIWHYNNYWKTLYLNREYLQSNKNNMPIFARNLNWKTKELHTAVGSWLNLQLAPDKLKIHQKYQGQFITLNDNKFISKNYIEPNLSLINEQIANVNMVLEMFKLLKITDELRSVSVNLEDLKNNLIRVKDIMIKELKSEALTEDDFRFISLLSMEYKMDLAENKNFIINSNNKKSIKYDISKPKLMILVSNDVNGEKSFSVAPVFNYIESR